jgi:peptidoglycan/LPS O-acetylase OafA/YrhL
VLAVVLYHFGLPYLTGGFVGVDIFFVISGFLIGGILWAELALTGTLSLKRFYLRRIRRLAPAFFTMAAVTTVFATLILLPFEFRDFGKELIAATVWLSNVLFYRGAGYFDTGEASKVLLHTWSLSVEEQFYIALPLTLLILKANRKLMIGVLVALWALSLVASISLTPSQPTATFYLFPFRAWELLSGVLLAVWGYQVKSSWAVHPTLSWIGIALLYASLLLIQPGPGFPGWQVLVPVLGTILILLNGADRNPVNRVLASPVPVFIGLISYSLYLWHWPVLTLSTYWRDGYSGLLETLLWLGLAVALSVLSWALVEHPARRATLVPNNRLLIGSGAAAILALSVGAWAYRSDGAPDRFGAMARPHIDASADFLQDWSRCTTTTDGPLAGVETCAIGPAGPPEVLIWGDSHLRFIMEGVAAAAEQAAIPGIIVWHAGCPPLFGLTKTENSATPAQDLDCLTDTQTLRAALPGMTSLNRIMLVGRWTYYAEGTGTGRDAANRITLAPAAGSSLSGDTQAELYAAAMDATITELATLVGQIAVLRQVPELPGYDSRKIARMLVHGQLTQEQAMPLFVVQQEVLAARVAQAEAPLTQAAAAGRITLIDTWTVLCSDICSAMQAGRSYYFDNNHLNNTGALALQGLFIPFLRGQQ